MRLAFESVNKPDYTTEAIIDAIVFTDEKETLDEAVNVVIKASFEWNKEETNIDVVEWWVDSTNYEGESCWLPGEVAIFAQRNISKCDLEEVILNEINS